MASSAGIGGGGRGSLWRIISWSAAGALLLIPLIAMRFTSDVTWTASDFLFMAMLIGSIGLCIEYLFRKSHSVAYRAGAAIALLAVFLIVWANAAVGMIGSENNPHNLLFAAVIAGGAVGIIGARFEPAGMARAMFATAILHALVGTTGLSSDPRGGVLSIILAAPWLISALLFAKAAREQD